MIVLLAALLPTLGLLPFDTVLKVYKPEELAVVVATVVPLWLKVTVSEPAPEMVPETLCVATAVELKLTPATLAPFTVA